jgi:hypothetical protein
MFLALVYTLFRRRFFGAGRTEPVRKEQSGVLEQVPFHVLPILTVVTNLATTHAYRNDVLESRDFCDVFEYHQDQARALWDWRCSDHEFHMFVRKALRELKLHPCSIDRLARHSASHGPPDHTVLANRPASTTGGNILRVETMQGVASANEVNIWLPRAERATGSGVEVAYAYIAIEDKDGQRYGVQNGSVIGGVVMGQTQPRSMPAAAEGNRPPGLDCRTALAENAQAFQIERQF